MGVLLEQSDCSRRRRVAIQTFEQLFTGCAKMFQEKGKQLEDLHRMVTNDEPLEKIEEKGLSRSPSPSQDELLAFAGHGPEEQHAFLEASSYQDEWVQAKLSDGTEAYFRSYYKCRCGCVMASKRWKRRFEPLCALNQRWYCVRKDCQLRYRTSFGQLIEIKLGALLLYHLASVPPCDIEDVRGMYTELKLRPQNPEQLYESIQVYRPVTGNTGCMLRAVAPHDVVDGDPAGVAMLEPATLEALEELPRFEWYQIFNWVTG